MNPVSLRAAGVRFDNQAAMPNDRIAAIRAPTLVVHAKDDTLQRYRHAEFAAATIPHARLVGFERGGQERVTCEHDGPRERCQIPTTLNHASDAAAEPRCFGRRTSSAPSAAAR